MFTIPSNVLGGIGLFLLGMTLMTEELKLDQGHSEMPLPPATTTFLKSR